MFALFTILLHFSITNQLTCFIFLGGSVQMSPLLLKSAGQIKKQEAMALEEREVLVKQYTFNQTWMVWCKMSKTWMCCCKMSKILMFWCQLKIWVRRYSS